MDNTPTAPLSPEMERFETIRHRWIVYALCSGIITMVALPMAFIRLQGQPALGPVVLGIVSVGLFIPGMVSFWHLDRVGAQVPLDEVAP